MFSKAPKWQKIKASKNKKSSAQWFSYVLHLTREKDHQREKKQESGKIII